MIYHGETKCQGRYASGEKCRNKAYFQLGEKYYCGVHGKGGTKLKANPQKKELDVERIKKELEEVEEARGEGDVIVTKLQMMKPAPYVKGYLKIFPNFRHGNRKDGFGCPSLSPMSLGPINHGMKNLPAAQNLENFHQGAKIFEEELENDIITKESFNLRKRIYLDKTPYRHKFKYPGSGIKSKIPLFSVYYDSKGIERRYTYIESRYFYCYWYQKLATQQEEFEKLLGLLDEGYNLQIVGFDGYSVEDLWEHYNDPSRPFGHELVLYTLLTQEEYPWTYYYKKNSKIYKDVIPLI